MGHGRSDRGLDQGVYMWGMDGVIRGLDQGVYMWGMDGVIGE